MSEKAGLNLITMKVAFVFFFFLALFADVFGFLNGNLSNAPFSAVEASLDQSLAYIVVTASILGIIKLKKNPR